MRKVRRNPGAPGRSSPLASNARPSLTLIEMLDAAALAEQALQPIIVGALEFELTIPVFDEPEARSTSRRLKLAGLRTRIEPARRRGSWRVNVGGRR